MTNAEIIKALRYCADEDKICTRQQNCGYYGKGFFCQDALMRDAADALEADEKRIADLEAQLPKEGECDAANVNGVQIDEDKTVMDCSYCPSADGCLEAFSKSTLCPRVTGEQMKGEHDED